MKKWIPRFSACVCVLKKSTVFVYFLSLSQNPTQLISLFEKAASRERTEREKCWEEVSTYSHKWEEWNNRRKRRARTRREGDERRDKKVVRIARGAEISTSLSLTPSSFLQSLLTAFSLPYLLLHFAILSRFFPRTLSSLSLSHSASIFLKCFRVCLPFLSPPRHENLCYFYCFLQILICSFL